MQAGPMQTQVSLYSKSVSIVISMIVLLFLLHLSTVPNCCCLFPKSTEIRIKSNLVTISFEKHACGWFKQDLDVIFIFPAENRFFLKIETANVPLQRDCAISRIFRCHEINSGCVFCLYSDVWKLTGFTRIAAISCALLPSTSMIGKFSFGSISATSLPTSNPTCEGLHLKHNTTRDASTHR